MPSYIQEILCNQRINMHTNRGLSSSNRMFTFHIKIGELPTIGNASAIPSLALVAIRDA